MDWEPDMAATADAGEGGESGALAPGEQSVFEYSSAMPQGSRQRLLRLAASGFAACPVLVCTDAASRGLDMPKLDAVIQYDPPAAAQAYVHRVGRTARARRAGQAITVCSPTEMRRFLGGRAMAGDYVVLSREGRDAHGDALGVEAAEEAAVRAQKSADAAAAGSRSGGRAGAASSAEAAAAGVAAARRQVSVARRAQQQDEKILRGAKPMVRLDAVPSAWESLLPPYDAALKALRPLVEAEEGGRLRVSDSPPAELISGCAAPRTAVESASGLWTTHCDEMDRVLLAAGRGRFSDGEDDDEEDDDEDEDEDEEDTASAGAARMIAEPAAASSPNKESGSGSGSGAEEEDEDESEDEAEDEPASTKESKKVAKKEKKAKAGKSPKKKAKKEKKAKKSRQ